MELSLKIEICGEMVEMSKYDSFEEFEVAMNERFGKAWWLLVEKEPNPSFSAKYRKVWNFMTYAKEHEIPYELLLTLLEEEDFEMDKFHVILLGESKSRSELLQRYFAQRFDVSMDAAEFVHEELFLHNLSKENTYATYNPYSETYYLYRTTRKKEGERT